MPLPANDRTSHPEFFEKISYEEMEVTFDIVGFQRGLKFYRDSTQNIP
tara:strand:- start:4617 stop:4760 length:144 start_codon:yes stop_codon:yes gene_type:complete